MANIADKSKKDPSLLLECHGAKMFMKIYQALEIDRIKFSFVKKGDERNPIDIYMNAEEFQSDLIAKINSGQLERRRLEEARRPNAAGDKHCQDIWASRVGKSPKNTIRKFSIQPGQRTEYVFYATETAENEKSNAKSIVVGCSGKDLILLAFRWSFLYEDYKAILCERYSMKNMKSSYHAKESEAGQEVSYDESLENVQQAAPPASTSRQTDTMQAGERGPRSFSIGSNDFQDTHQDIKSQDSADTYIPQGKVEQFKLKVATSIVQMRSGKYALEGYTQDNIKYAVVFDPSIFSGLNSWENFYKSCTNIGNIIRFKGIVAKDRIMATEIV